MEEIKCCICGKTFKGYGNNTWPVVTDENARCCDDCNYSEVIPARLRAMGIKKNGTEQSK